MSLILVFHSFLLSKFVTSPLVPAAVGRQVGNILIESSCSRVVRSFRSVSKGVETSVGSLLRAEPLKRPTRVNSCYTFTCVPLPPQTISLPSLSQADDIAVLAAWCLPGLVWALASSPPLLCSPQRAGVFCLHLCFVMTAELLSCKHIYS